MLICNSIKLLCHLIQTLRSDDNSNLKEAETAEAVEDVVTRITEIEARNVNEENSSADELHSHILTMDKNGDVASFTAQLSDVIVTHALTAQVPQR